MTLQKGVTLGKGGTASISEEFEGKLNALQNEIFAIKEIATEFRNEMRDELIKRGSLMKEIDSYLCEIRSEAKEEIAKAEVEHKRNEEIRSALQEEIKSTISEIKSDAKSVLLHLSDEIGNTIAFHKTEGERVILEGVDGLGMIRESSTRILEQIKSETAIFMNELTDKRNKFEKETVEASVEMSSAFEKLKCELKEEIAAEGAISNEINISNEEKLNKIRNEINCVLDILKEEIRASALQRDEIREYIEDVRGKALHILSDVEKYKGEKGDKGDDGFDGKDGVCSCRPPSMSKFEFSSVLHCSSGKWDCPVNPSFTITRVENLCNLYLGGFYVFRKGGSCSSFKFEDEHEVGISSILVPANRIISPCFIQTKQGDKIVASVTIETDGKFYLEGINGYVFKDDFSILPINLSWSLI